jgi:Ca2+-binding RTX toxin-like protein
MTRPTRLVAFVLIGLLAALALPAAASAAPRCFGRVANVVGTRAGDRLQGTPRSDVIVGLGGRDEIAGRGGNDRICGGRGLDLILGQAGNDLINGGAIFDVGGGGSGNDLLKGSGGDDVLIGQGGGDRLLGGASRGIEVLGPGAGDDFVNGGGGTADLVSFADSGQGVVVDLSLTMPQPTGQGLDRIVGAEGLEGSDLDDELTGNGILTVNGNGLFGLGGDDVISGLSGVDFLFGENGDDDLFGGDGDDFLDGGAEVTQDFGNGGVAGETDGDFCTEIEVPVNCEEEGVAAVSSSLSSWAGPAGTMRDTWWWLRL